MPNVFRSKCTEDRVRLVCHSAQADALIKRSPINMMRLADEWIEIQV